MIMKITLMKWTALLGLALLLLSATPVNAGTPDAERLETVRAELLDLARRDGEARDALVGAWELDGKGGFKIDGDIMNAVMAIDAESKAYLKALVEEMGWPTIDMVGEDGSAAAWLLKPPPWAADLESSWNRRNGERFVLRSRGGFCGAASPLFGSQRHLRTQRAHHAPRHSTPSARDGVGCAVQYL